MKLKVCGCLSLFLFCLALPRHTRAETQILKGEHVVVYEIKSNGKAVYPPDIHTATFSQEVLEKGKNTFHLRVTSMLKPLNSKTSFPVDVKKLPAEIQPYLAQTTKVQKKNTLVKSIAEKQTSGAHFQWEAAASIMRWVKDNIVYDMTLNYPVDAVSTLKNKTSRCEGYTNLSLALLRAANIPSRAVTYYTAPGHEWGVVPGQGGMHSALEIYYPDAGWIAYEPQGTLHYVDPFHIYLFSEVDDEGSQFLYEGASSSTMKMVKGREDYKNLYDYFNSNALSVKTVSEKDETYVFDMFASPKEIMFSAPANDAMNFATITGKIINSSTGCALSTDVDKAWIYLWTNMEGKGYFVSRNGSYSITGLTDGNYSLSAKADSFSESEKQSVTVKEKSLQKINFSLSKGGTLSGKIAASNGSKLSGYIVGIQTEKSADGSFSYIPYDVDPDGSFIISDIPESVITFIVVNKKTGTLEYEKPISIVPEKELVLTITLP